MRAIVAALAGIFLSLASTGCGPGSCIQSKGHPYNCVCSRRCQGTTADWSTSHCADSASEAQGLAQGACGNSCSPEATCATCSCTQGVGECLKVNSCR